MAAILSSEGLVWVSANSGDSVDDAIVGGSAEDGAELHITRARVGEELATGKLHVGHECGYIPSHGKEEKVEEYEVLANRGGVELEWVAGSGSAVPNGAVVGGSDAEDLPIFIVRCNHEADVIPGKLIVSNGKAYVSWGGEEHAYDDYEILCVKTVKPVSE